jgi:hypothetical protein
MPSIRVAGCSANPVFVGNGLHNRFGWQVKNATTNGVFRPFLGLKKCRFGIVKGPRFSYILALAIAVKFERILPEKYVKYL